MNAPRADYAADPARSRGRRHPEPSSPTRSEFQRDRDRIVHCAAFRRLEYKTQVFVNHEGDLFRTRLTHSIEVAQIARSVSRCLRLDEDLVEAIALAHDLGHTPFGHAGQDALDACMKPWGGFEHNLQSLRVVDELEQRYAAFDGLNLCFETREGILKHCSAANARRLGELGERFLARRQPSLEAQVANLADEIAYNNHDIDDGLRSGLVRLDAPPLAAFTDRIRAQSAELKRFLFTQLYRHERVSAVMDRARTIVEELFAWYRADPGLLPVEHRERVEAIGERAIADYIAGMTDRFAVREHSRLSGVDWSDPGAGLLGGASEAAP